MAQKLVTVGRTDEFSDSKSRVIEVNGTKIGVYCLGSKYYAYENVCDHQGGPVCEGGIYPHTEYSFDKKTGVVTDVPSKTNFSIACPWHGIEYDLTTGVCRGNNEMKLHSFKVVVEGNVVKVSV